MRLIDLTGVWLAPLKGDIPNYNSNFTNWVDGALADGHLQLVVEGAASALSLKLEVPVMFSGGLGTYRLYEGRLSLLDNYLSLDQGGTTTLRIPFRRISPINLELTLFDKAFLFVREKEV